MHIYLSPHHDDVCFSLAHLASRQKGELVNIFTTSNYVARPMALPVDRAARIEAISALRRDEDLRFVTAAGLKRHDLRLADTSAIGRPAFDVSHLDEDIGQVSTKLIPYIWGLLPADSDPTTAFLFCPMGIGGHRNHRATLCAVYRERHRFSCRCTIFLYEDLHYASSSELRRRNAEFVAQLCADAQLTPIVIPLNPSDAARKMELVALYASQHETVPALSFYTPASPMAPKPHELVWRVSLPNASQT